MLLDCTFVNALCCCIIFYLFPNSTILTVHKTVVRAREAGTSIVGEGLGKREKLENRDTVNSVNIDSRKMPKAPAKRI